MQRTVLAKVLMCSVFLILFHVAPSHGQESRQEDGEFDDIWTKPIQTLDSDDLQQRSSNGCGGTRVPYEARWLSYNPQNGQTDWIYRFKLGQSRPTCLQLLYQPAWWCWPMTPWGFTYQYKLYKRNNFWYIEVVLNQIKVCTMTCYCNGYFEMEYR